MKVQKPLFISTTLIVLTSLNLGFAENPLIQTNYTPDPAPLSYKDTVFLYTGHDEDNATGFTMYNYMLYTSTDLVNWTDHGSIASLKSFSWTPTNGAWAAQCVHRNGKFYYYVSIHGKGIGVLVADSPYGPFKDPLGKPLFYHNWNDIDPTVLVDDDGQAYMYWGNPECYWVKLNPDMISLAGKIDSLVPRMKTYQEGPWIYKRDKKYYLSWSSTCCPEGIGYAMSDNPTGPWTYKNSIMDGNSNSSGNQPGMFDFKGSTYTTGFTNELWYSIQGGRTTRYERRSASLAKITFNADGSIPKLPWFGVGNPTPGVPQVGSFNPYDTVQAETICWSKGVRTEVCKDVSGKMNVDSIHNGDYIKVKGVDFKSGPKLFEARVASGSSGGSIEIFVDSVNGTKIGTCTFQGTNGWQTWVTKSCEVSGVSGKHDLFLKFTGGNGLLFNFNWWKFTSPVAIESGLAKSISNIKAGLTVHEGRNIILNLYLPKQAEHNSVKVCLYDISGKLVTTLIDKSLQSTQAPLLLNQRGTSSGTYLAKVFVNDRTVLTEKLHLQ